MAVLLDTQTREPVGIEPVEDHDRPAGPEADCVCAMSRADDGGTYQDQAGPTLPRGD